MVIMMETELMKTKVSRSRVSNIIIFLILLTIPKVYFSQDTCSIMFKEGYGNDSIVFIGESKKSIIKKYGKPNDFIYTKYRKLPSTHPHNKRSTKTVIVKKLGSPKNILYYSNLELFIHLNEDDLVDRIYFHAGNYCTLKGLKIGDNKQKAYELYREGNSPVLECPNLGIDIEFECDTIKEIRIYKPR